MFLLPFAHNENFIVCCVLSLFVFCMCCCFSSFGLLVPIWLMLCFGAMWQLYGIVGGWFAGPPFLSCCLFSFAYRTTFLLLVLSSSVRTRCNNFWHKFPMLVRLFAATALICPIVAFLQTYSTSNSSDRSEVVSLNSSYNYQTYNAVHLS